ncbi:MAG: phosphopentomutase [Spirochaetia bacterium]
MKAILMVIDGLGMGSLPDAERYGDTGANTLLHLCEAYPAGTWPTLKSMGLGNCVLSGIGRSLPGCEPLAQPSASFGFMAEKSPGKDSTTGHWEIAGLVAEKPFRIFPPAYPSFPDELIASFEKRIGRKVLGNKAASGTVIIEELGAEHLASGRPICYTAADSILQIAAHEEVIPLAELYRMCEIAREICDHYNVSRVIARPFVGRPGSFKRTDQRKDFSISLPGPSVIDVLQQHGVRTIGVGKIGDLFNESGLDESFHDKGNRNCMERLLMLGARTAPARQFIFANLIDTDMLYGHRRDTRGFRDAVSAIDSVLGPVLKTLERGDVLIITADHGCDPTFKGTDHTREYVPLLVYQPGYAARDLGLRRQFSDVAESLLSFFGIAPVFQGQSFMR